MAKDYKSAIERARKLREERAGTTPVPSLMLSGAAQSEANFGSTKDYSAAIERMRANQIKRKESERPHAQLDTLRNRFQDNPSRLPSYTETAEKNLVADSVIGRGINTYSLPIGVPYQSQEELQREIDRIKNVDKPAAGEKYENALKYYDRDSEEVKNAYEEFEGMDGKIQKLEEKIKLREEYDKYVEYQEKYASLVNNADFEENSKYKSTANGEKQEINVYTGEFVGSGFDNAMYDAINGNPDAIKELQNERVQYDSFGLTGHFDLEELQMNKDEVAIFNYLFNTQGTKASEEYLKFIQSDLYKRERIEAETKAKEYAKEHPISSSLGTIATSPLKGLSYIGQGLDFLANGEIDANKSYNRYSYEAQATREEVSNLIERKWGKLGSGAYNIGMSLADSVMASAVTGGSNLSMAIIGSGIAADTTLNAIERGLPPEKAILLGAASGAIEAVTEKLSLDALYAGLGKKMSKNELVRYIFSNTATEASEEAISEVANTIADVIIAGDQAELVVSVNEYRMAGLSESEALTKVLLEKLGDVGLAALGGALSGFTMSGSVSAVKLGSSAIETGIDKVADVNTKLKAQEIIRGANASDTVAQEKADQKKYTVLPTLLDIEKAKARKNSDVFDIGYEKPYTGVANTFEEGRLEMLINAKKSITEKTGLRHGASYQQIADALELGRALGREIEFFTQKSADGKTVKDGFYSTENGHIYVNVNAAKSLETVISHELTHSLEGTTLYNELETLARDYMQRKGRDFDGAMADARKLYEKAGVDYAGDDAQIKNEVIANFVEKNILGDKKTILEITKNKPSIARRIRMFLANLLSKLSKNRAGNAYAAAQNIKNMYDTAMSAAEEAPTAEGVVENATLEKTAEQSESTVEESAEDVAEDTDADKETPTREEKTVREASRDSERAEEETAKKEKAPAKTETKSDKVSSSRSGDTHTVIDKDAEAFMRDAEDKFDAGEITKEEFEARERYYDNWIERGGEGEWSSEGFEEGWLQRKARRAGDKILGRGGNWSVSVLEDGSTYVTASRNIITGTSQAEKRKQITQFFNELLRGQSSLDIHTIEGDILTITKSETADKARDNYRTVNGKRVKLSDEEFAVKLRAEAHIDEIVETSIENDNKEDGKQHYFARDGFSYRTTYFEDFDGKYYKLTLSIGNNGNVATVYNIGQIKESVPPSAKLIAVVGSKAPGSTLSYSTVSQTDKDVNPDEETVTKLQQSVSETEGVKTEQTTTDAYSELDSKAKTYLRKIERRIGIAFDMALGLDLAGEDGKYMAAEFREFLREAVRPITNEYLTTGDISQDTISDIFEKYYKSPYGLPAGMYDREKMDARGVFENIINENWNDLRNVRMYMEEKNREKANAKVAEPIEREDARRRFDALRSAQKFERKALRRNLLTDSDMLVVGELLRGDTSLKNVNPVKHNVEGIRAVFEAKQQTKEVEAAVSEYRRQVKARLYEKMDKYLDTMLEWKDKKNGLLYERETLERNIRDIVGDKALADQIIRDLISPVHQHEADSVRWKKKLADRVRALDISTKKSEGGTVSESYAVQLYGEASDNIKMLEESGKPDAKRDGFTLEEWQGLLDKMWAENPNLDQAKIKKAAEEFRKIYEEIFTEMNNVLLDNGCAPVAYRSGYFPHFTGEEETVLAKFGRIMGIKTEMVALPTTINGMTEHFKPGKPWFGHAQERKGFYTTYDAVTGFEQYIKGASDLIFHTEDIQNFRALANRIRYNASDAGIQKKIDEVIANDTLDDAEKEVQLKEIRKDGKYALAEFVAYLDEYTNKLANKKSSIDRGWERRLGRKFYVTMRNIESRVAANMIVGKLSSALTNFIPVNQAGAQLGWKWMLKGMQTSYKNVLNGDSFSESSTFLMNRRGYDPLVQTWIDKAANVGGKAMEIIDNFAAETIVRAAYAKNLAAGLTADEALYQADLFAASVMADRSKGAMPLIFESKNPLMKLFTQFQLEVNNEFSVLFKDIPRMERKKWTESIAMVLLKYFVGAWIFNELYEKLVGRRPALDPIGIVLDTVEDIREGKKPGEVITNFGSNVLDELPFVGGLAGGGRIPIQSAIPNIPNFVNAISNPEWDEKKKFHEAWQEISKPLAYLVPPAGGGVLKNLGSGIKFIAEGGKYTYDAEGNKMLQYPFYGDQGFTTWFEGARALAFGTTSTAPGQEWVNEGFGSLGAKQTAVYESLIESGVGEKEAYDLINALADVEPEVKETIERTYSYAGITVKIDEPLENDVNVLSKAEMQRQMLRDSTLDGEGRSLVYFGLFASQNEQRLMYTLDDLGADMGEATDVLMGFKDAENTVEKLDLLIGADLEDDEKRFIYEDRISDSRVEDIYAFTEAGMNFDTFLECNKKFNELYNGDGNASYKATQLARWINQKGFSEGEKAVIEEAFKFYSMMPAKPQAYDKYVEAGLDDETAYKLVTAISDLEPLEGKTNVSNLQKYRAVVDNVASPVYQMDALQTVMTESAFKKTSVAYSYGIEAETYITYLEELSAYDEDGSGSLSQMEVETALRKLAGNLTVAERLTIELTGGEAPGLLYVSDDQLAVLWQLSGNWSPKNNPYSVKIGEAVQAALGKK